MRRNIITNHHGMVHFGCADCEVGEFLPWPPGENYCCWNCGKPLALLSIGDLLNRRPARRYSGIGRGVGDAARTPSPDAALPPRQGSPPVSATT